MKKSILSLAVITLIWITSFSQIDTISTNIYQNDGKLGIGDSNPSANASILSDDTYDFYEKLLELRINGISDSYLQFRNNTIANSRFEPCIHGFTSFSERAGLIIMGGILEDGDNNDNAIVNISSYVDNGLGWANGGYDYPDVRHYFRIKGHKSGIGDKYLFEIDQNGNIGIGTKTPNAKLEITDGDIYISDIEKGIIMKSPDGQCWRGTLDNLGDLNFIQIDCPFTVVSTTQLLNSTLNVMIYPNPTEDIVTVELENMSVKKIKYSIFNSNGQLIKKENINSKIYQIDISDLSTGIYILTINDKRGNKLASKQVIKK